MAEFVELEEQDGIRMPFNVWPNNKLEATKSVIPLSAFYTPLKPVRNLQVLPYPPVTCKSCGGVLNPYAQLDFAGKLWMCPFCHTRNHFPSHYQGMTEECRVAELFPEYSTVEYSLPRTVPANPPAYIFVIDITVAEDELQACCQAITQALQMLPEQARVGLITFGTHVQVYELGFSECVKAYVFRGSKEYTFQQVQEQLGLAPRMGQAQAAARATQTMSANSAGASRFVRPMSECEYLITGILEELQRDAFPAVAKNRPSRCSGTALQIAACLMGGCLPAGSCMGRLMLFVGGPATEGPGRVVEKELVEPIRSHKDLVKDTAPLYKKAKKFYDSIAAQLVSQGHILDVFAVALEQQHNIKVAFCQWLTYKYCNRQEMKEAVERTGGLTVQTDTYANPIFYESLPRLFVGPEAEGFLRLVANATLEVIPSRDVKICGLLGPAAAVDKKGVSVSENVIGIGGTTQWKVPSMNSNTTMLTFFDVVGGGKEKDGSNLWQQFFLQFVTKYQTLEGELRCRVSTVTRRFVDGSNVQDLIAGFDQEAAAVAMARLCSHKMEVEEEFDATRWLDRSLIRLSQRFGEYTKDDAESFALSPQMSLYPQFMFNLRRSHFVQVFGFSPDETAHSRLLLNMQPVADGVVMIQPQIFAYSLATEGPEPVLLDVTSIAPDRILFLDAFHYVVVFSGTTIAQWRAADYQSQPEYANFAALLKVPVEEAEGIARRRFPVPRIVQCDHNGSQARFLLARLNPSATYNSSNVVSNEVIMTDDVSLEVFFQHLKALAVAS